MENCGKERILGSCHALPRPKITIKSSRYLNRVFEIFEIYVQPILPNLEIDLIVDKILRRYFLFNRKDIFLESRKNTKINYLICTTCIGNVVLFNGELILLPLKK